MTAEPLDAAVRLHGHLLNRHWTGNVLAGPDPGIRYNARVWRFVKSYLPFITWSDDLTYIQAQAYWILSNWRLWDLTGDSRYEALAVEASRGVLELQQPAGYWSYPNPEWSGRIATVEGCFGAIGLLETYSRTGDLRFLEGALAWYGYMRIGIGFRRQGDEMLAVNYFAHGTGDGGGVPNNSTLALWMLGKLARITGDDSYLELASPMVAWLRNVQVATGELPYSLGRTADADQLHFLCHQYNAFEFMDLVAYHRLTGDPAVLPVMENLASFLATGFTNQGFARYDCDNDRTEVVYYTTALAQALRQATEIGLGDHSAVVERAYGRVMSQQRGDGSFEFHSRGNYGLLTDRRSYPRYLSMILLHLVREHQALSSALDR